MRKIFLLTAVAAFLLFSSPAILHASAQGGKDNLSNEQAKGLLSDLIPNTKIIYIRPSPIAGLWEIGIEAKGKKAILYIDYSKKYVISPVTRGAILDLKTKANLTEESLQKITKVDISQIPLKDALVLGDRNAKYKVIVFSDPD